VALRPKWRMLEGEHLGVMRWKKVRRRCYNVRRREWKKMEARVGIVVFCATRGLCADTRRIGEDKRWTINTIQNKVKVKGKV